MMPAAPLLCLALLSAAPKPAALAGRWEGEGFLLQLDAGGTGTIADGPSSPPEPIQWRASANALHITQDGEAQTYAMRLAGDSLSLSGGDLDGAVTLRRTGAARGPPALETGASKTAGPRQPPTCPGACAHFLTCAQRLGATDLGPPAQATCLRECQGTGMTPQQLAAFNALSCEQAVALVLAAEQAARGQPEKRQTRQGGACAGCVRWGDDCMWTSQSDWGPGHAGNRYSGAVASCDPSCCGL
jgi:hypothetical protein